MSVRLGPVAGLSTATGHYAVALPDGRWEVSWLPDPVASRQVATSALMLAEILACRPAAPGALVCALAGELGLTGQRAAALLGG